MEHEPPTSREQLGVLFSPKNILKWIAASFPGASSGVEMANQLEGHGIQKRFDSMAGEVELLRSLNSEKAQAAVPPVSDWSIPANEYLRRTVDLAVAYDGQADRDSAAGKERVLPVSHACLLSENELVASTDAIDMARKVAEHKKGRVVVLAGMAWHELENEKPHAAMGLSVFKLPGKDEKRWSRVCETFKGYRIDDELEETSFEPIVFSPSAFPGQEIGFVHAGEAEDVVVSLDAFSRRQFDCTTVSHVKRPTDEALVTFVTAVLPGRIVYPGSPVFSREGVLMGLIADTENYPSDAGRRAVIRGLAGHPRFSKGQSE